MSELPPPPRASGTSPRVVCLQATTFYNSYLTLCLLRCSLFRRPTFTYNFTTMTTATSPVLESLSTHSSALLHEPVVEIEPESPSEVEFEHSSDGDTASQRSISLSSPPRSPRESAHLDDIELGVPEHSDSLVTPVALVRQGLSNRDSHPYTLDTDFSSEHDGDDRSSFMRRLDDGESPVSSLAPSLHEKDKDNAIGNEEVVDLTEEEVKIRTRDSIRASVASFVSTTSYPPPPIQTPDPRKSIASFASGSSYSKKVRPESMLVTHKGPLVLGIALVDFNHLVRVCETYRCISLLIGSAGWSYD